ncbi:MAG TPA: CHAT domain-containing protein [Pyrinomonadaceae bacterium]|nr:CHAT domain-containing protein [Pyrinomonadaceae bacterium]
MFAFRPAAGQTVSQYSCRDTPTYELARIRGSELIAAISGEFETVGNELYENGDRAGAIRCLNEAAKLRIGVSEFESAERALDKANKIALQYGVHEHIASTLNTLFLAAYQRGKVDKVRAYQVELLRVLPMVTENRAAVFYSLGLFEYSFGKVGKARSYFEQAEPIVQSTEDPRIICQVYIYSGYSAIREDDPFTTLDKANTALSIAQQYDYAKGRSNANFALAYTRVVLGDNQLALETLKAAEADLLPDADMLEHAIILNTKASIYLELGRLDVARPNYQRAIEYFDRLKNPRGRMSAMLSIADIEFGLDNKQEALRLYEEVRKIATSLDDKFQLGVISERIGDVAFSNGELNVALEKYRSAMSAYESKGVRLARIENSIALVLERIGDTAKAQALIESARVNNDKIRDPVELARNYFHLARIAAGRGDAKKAESHIVESIKITDKLHSSIDGSDLRTSYFAKVTDRFDLYVSLLMSGKLGTDQQRARSDALAVVERSRARTLRDTLALAGSDFRRDASPEIVKREREILTVLNLKKSRLTDLLTDKGDAAETETLEREIAQTEEDLDNIRLQLRRDSPIYSQLKSPDNFDLADFQANVLKDDELLLEFSLGVQESYLWAVDKQSIAAFKLPSRAIIEGKVNRLRELLGSRELKPGESLEVYDSRIKAAEADYASEARALSNELFGQAYQHFAGKKLIVAADGRLHQFPVGALPVPTAQGIEPILLSNEVTYVPSATALKILRMERNADRKPEQDVLVFADPVFSRSDERVSNRDSSVEPTFAAVLSTFRNVESLTSLSRLPASEDEARSISEVVGTRRTKVLSGFSANRDGVMKGDIEDFRVVHFATHGLIDENRPELSGILLSVFDSEGKELDGGFVRMQDVFGLRLNSDLVVLSACNTGIGKEVKGEGVMSINSAFLQAGARSVVSSFWKVDDVATKELMTEFYRGLSGDGLAPSAALRQAQIQMFKDSRFRSPFYWAAFAASGDGRVNIAFASNTPAYLYYAAASLLLAILTVLGIRQYRCRNRSQT